MVDVEYLPKGCWGTVNKAFPLVLDATGQAAELCALDLRYPILLMIGGIVGWYSSTVFHALTKLFLCLLGCLLVCGWVKWNWGPDQANTRT